MSRRRPSARPAPLLAAALAVALAGGQAAAGGPLPGFDSARRKEAVTTWYWPRWWGAFDKVLLVPLLGRPDAGGLTMALEIFIKDAGERDVRYVEFVVDGQATRLDLEGPAKPTIDRHGCVPVARVLLLDQEDLVRRIASSGIVRMTYGGRKPRGDHTLGPVDRERFERVMNLHDRARPPRNPASVLRESVQRPLVQGQQAVPTLHEPLLTATAGVTNPRLIPGSKVAPTYPLIARRQVIEKMGHVILQAVIHKDGSVGEIEILQGPGGECEFEEAAVEAVRRWRYEPAMMDGKPVDVYWTIVVDFVFNGQEKRFSKKPGKSPDPPVQDGPETTLVPGPPEP